jgi:hypothetical protein
MRGHGFGLAGKVFEGLNVEEATRQQGGLFFWENSSNGGKAIRTFWSHTMSAKKQCQGEKRGIATDSKEAA